MEKCSVAGKTKMDYTCTVNFFKKAARKLYFDKMMIRLVKRQHILLMLDEIKKQRKWSNHAYNKNAGYISGVLSRLVKYEIIEYNPAHKIAMLPTTETNKFETLSEDEKITIRDHLTKVHPSFFTYLMIIYHCGIRPKEVLALKVSDVRLDKNLIIIKPDINKENSKTPSIRMVPLNKHVSELLRNHIEGSAADYFIFGGPNGPGGNRGSGKGGKAGSMRSDYFSPSEFHIKRDTATRLWSKLVIVGLGINKYMYALKHTGGDDKILAGIPIDALREMYGHSSRYMTEKYARKIKGVYRDQIIINSPDF
jgi:integrase